MADVYGGATPLTSRIAEFQHRPKDGDHNAMVYKEVASSETIYLMDFVENVSGKIGAAETADTIYGISLGTNVTTNLPSEVGQFPQPRSQAGVRLIPVLLADENLEFVMKADADTTLSMEGTTVDIVFDTGVTDKWYIDVGVTTNNTLYIVKLIDPPGNFGRRCLCKIASGKRGAA